jgi:hypothetical protein
MQKDHFVSYILFGGGRPHFRIWTGATAEGI